MRPQFKAALAASSFTLLGLAAAQQVCNPLQRDDCAPRLALPALTEIDFKKGPSALPSTWSFVGSSTPVTWTSEGVELTISKRYDYPTLVSSQYFHFGSVEVYFKAAYGSGILSSLTLLSDTRDEIDLEIRGNSPRATRLQYFGKGSTGTFAVSKDLFVGANMTEKLYPYRIEHKKATTEFWINNRPARNFSATDGGSNGNGARYPQTPMTVQIGAYAAGDKDAQSYPGKFDCGKVDYSKGPFKLLLVKLKVINSNPGYAYAYTDKSGASDKIKVLKDAKEFENYGKPSSSPIPRSTPTPTPTPSPSPSPAPAPAPAPSSIAPAVPAPVSAASSAVFQLAGPSSAAIVVPAAAVPSAAGIPVEAASYPVSSAQPAAAEPSCGLIGYDKENPQAFLLDTKKTSFDACKAFCQEKSKCKAFATCSISGMCLLYADGLAKNFLASDESTYTFYEREC